MLASGHPTMIMPLCSASATPCRSAAPRLGPAQVSGDIAIMIAQPEDCHDSDDSSGPAESGL